jgi:hypothetical protein
MWRFIQYSKANLISISYIDAIKFKKYAVQIINSWNSWTKSIELAVTCACVWEWSGPNTNLVAFVESQTCWTVILEDGEIIGVLIEFHASVKPKEIKNMKRNVQAERSSSRPYLSLPVTPTGMCEVSLSRTLEFGFGFFPDDVDGTSSVDNPNDSIWWQLNVSWIKKKVIH